nr:hypothetical protein [Xanthomonas melonis]
MQLIDHQIAQRIRLLSRPQWRIGGTDQQEIQHLVVSQQNIRRVFAQGVSVGDDREAAIGQLLHAGGFLGRGLAHVQARADTGQGWCAQDLLGQAAGLVRGQRVHRVQDDGLDARPAQFPLFAAMLQDWIEEALGLARAGAGGHQGRSSLLSGQACERPALVGMGDEARRQPAERGLASIGLLAERQRQG